MRRPLLQYKDERTLTQGPRSEMFAGNKEKETDFFKNL